VADRVDPRDVGLGLVVVGVRAAASTGRLLLLPVRIAIRIPPTRRAAQRLELEGRSARLRARFRLEAIGDDVLAAPEVDALGRSLAEHRVLERVARPVVDAADVEAALAAALEDARTERLFEQALESELTARVTDRVLASPELERVVEQVASSTAVRAAVAQQTTTFAGEIVAALRKRAERADDGAERWVRRLLRRPTTRPADAAGTAGIATRGIALAADMAGVHLIFLIGAALIGLVASLVGDLRPEWLVALLAGLAWTVAVTVYFVLFWTVAGQTPGMRAMRLRVATRDGEPPTLGRSLVRLVGLVLAIVPLFAGFLPVLVDDRRRALQDFLAGTVVLYADREP
jgi:uncharacterized RDD family membrane protein YckC